ncbi:hypothetical protein D9M68_1008970 [compost metagenome]
MARVKASNRLALNSAVCLVCASSSIRPISEATEEFLKMLRNSEVSGGMMMRKACGSRT